MPHQRRGVRVPTRSHAGSRSRHPRHRPPPEGGLAAIRPPAEGILRATFDTVKPTDEEAFRARYVIAQAVDYGSGTGGVQVGGIALGNAQGRMVYEPDHPLADENGNVLYPDIDLGSQMSQMIMAQRGYQANLAVVDRAKDAYQSALQLGKG